MNWQKTLMVRLVDLAERGRGTATFTVVSLKASANYS